MSPALFPAVTVTVVRDRKIRTALRTNQIVGFVTVSSWKKIRDHKHHDGSHDDGIPDANFLFQSYVEAE